MLYLPNLATYLVLITCSLKFVPAAAQAIGLLKRYQLSIYDPTSGRQLNPLKYLQQNTRFNRRDLQPNDNLIELPSLWNPCSCSDFVCLCCVGIRFIENLDNRFCLVLEYNAAELALQMRINYNKLTLANFGFSARNPPPYCIPILLPLPLFTCIRAYNIQARDGNFQLCLALILNIFRSPIFEYRFNCVRFGANGMEFITPMRDVEHIDVDEESIQYVRPSQKPPGEQQKLQHYNEPVAHSFFGEGRLRI